MNFSFQDEELFFRLSYPNQETENNLTSVSYKYLAFTLYS